MDWSFVKKWFSSDGPGSSLLTTGLIMVIYAVTAPRDMVSFADSLEMVTASHLLIPAHPPGFPLYIVLGKIGTWLLGWIQSVYLRYVILTIVYSSCALFLLIEITRRITGSRLAAVLLGVLAGLSREYWLYAIVPEVFSLNILLVAVAIYAYTRWILAGAPATSRSLLIAFFVVGLGWCNHWTIILLLPGFALGLFFHRMTWRVWARSAAVCVTGALPVFLVLLLMSRPGPLVFVSDPTWSGFLDMILRRRYGALAPGGGDAMTPDSLLFFLHSLIGQYRWLSVILFGAGIWGLWRKNRALIFIPVTMILSGPAFIFYMNIGGDSLTSWGMMERFHVMPLALYAMVMACGLSYLLARARPVQRTVLLALVLVGFLGMHILRHGASVDRRDDRVTRSFVQMALEDIPEGAVLLTYNDAETFALSYALYVEQPLRKIILLNIRGLGRVLAHPERLLREWDQRQVMPRPLLKSDASRKQAFVTDNLDRIPMYGLLHAIQAGHGLDTTRFSASPTSGLAFRLMRSGVAVPPDFSRSLFARDVFGNQSSAYADGVGASEKPRGFWGTAARWKPINHFNLQMRVIRRLTLDRSAEFFGTMGRYDLSNEIVKRRTAFYPDE